MASRRLLPEVRPGVAVGDGRYALERLIGTGGMASVWRATDRRLERPVAIKLIAEELADDPGYVARFAREARIAARLSHPNLVGIYDYGAEDQQPFLVMEYVDGGTLAERIRRGPVRGTEARAVAADLLAALGAIHAAGVVHRDVKPANVLLSSDGRAKVTDFGVARPQGAARLTDVGLVVGTLRYLAPEVVAGEPPSARSDLYALGVLLRDLSPASPDPTTGELIARLTDPAAERRPASAELARLLLDGAPPPRARREPREPNGAVPRCQPRPAELTSPEPLEPNAAVPRRQPRPAELASREPVTDQHPAGLVEPPIREQSRPRPGPAAAPGRPRRRRAIAPGSRGRGGRLIAIAAVCAVLAGAIGLVAGGGGPSAPHAAPAAARTGLAARLDELERLVRAAGNH